MCCDGHECGCMGKPIDPVVCSYGCGMIAILRHKTFFSTAAFRDEELHDFGIDPKFSESIYGVDPSKVLKVKMTLAEDQTRPQKQEDRNAFDYWGWYDAEDREFAFIYPAYTLLEICFPYGIKAEEEVKRGWAFRLNVEVVS